IQGKQAEATRVPPAPTSPPRPPAGGSSSWTSSTSEPAKDYVYHERAPLPEPPKAPSQDAVASALSTASLGAPSLPPSPLVSPAKENVPPKIEEEKRFRTTPDTPEEFTATRVSSPRFDQPPASFQLPAPKSRGSAVPVVREEVLEKPKRQVPFIGSLRLGSFAAKLQIGIA